MDETKSDETLYFLCTLMKIFLPSIFVKLGNENAYMPKFTETNLLTYFCQIWCITDIDRMVMLNAYLLKILDVKLCSINFMKYWI